MASEDEELAALLDDLEQQADALYDAERAPELADRSRSEYQHVTLAGRLMASVETDVSLHVAGLGAVTGVLTRVAAGWCVVESASQRWLVDLGAVLAVDGASDRAVPEVAWPAVARLGIGSGLRRLADAGERCVLHRRDGGRHDGVVRRVGADFVELAEGEAGRVVLVALGAVAVVQSTRYDD